VNFGKTSLLQSRQRTTGAGGDKHAKDFNQKQEKGFLVFLFYSTYLRVLGVFAVGF
jgi:hypothetical protein